MCSEMEIKNDPEDTQSREFKAISFYIELENINKCEKVLFIN